jgi:RhoGAP domain
LHRVGVCALVGLIALVFDDLLVLLVCVALMWIVLLRRLCALLADESETRAVKQQLSKGTFTKTDDVNAIANLLKVWYRELPTPLLNAFPTETFKECEVGQCCVVVVFSRFLVLLILVLHLQMNLLRDLLVCVCVCVCVRSGVSLQLSLESLSLSNLSLFNSLWFLCVFRACALLLLMYLPSWCG